MSLSFERLFEIRGHKGIKEQMSLISFLMTNTDGADKCWNWKGSTDTRGYAQIRVDAKLYYAHRVMAFVTFGLPLDRTDLVVCHSCDNCSCINPTHLFVGSQSDNLNDMYQKGRRSQTGRRNRRAIPNEKDLKFIAALDSGMTITAAGETVGYSRSYSSTVKSVMIPKWKLNGYLPKRGD